ncbi:MAG TPA: TetR/AcrR family transcriptional regulator [Candidatus Binatus sp.]|nr:TetR/AcrR family transcriptional regulator [Candidatus Binatus sp.]
MATPLKRRAHLRSTNGGGRHHGNGHSRRPARPSANTYDHILSVAEQEFAHSGYNGTSLAVIARRTGIRKASLFHHFDSKRRLFDAVVRRIFDQVAFIGRETVGSDDPRQNLVAIVGRLHDFIARHPNYSRILMHRVLEDPRSVRNAAEVFIKPVVLYMAELITRGENSGTFKKVDDPIGVALAALGIPILAYGFAPVVEACTGLDVFSPETIARTREEVIRRTESLVLPQ